MTRSQKEALPVEKQVAVDLVAVCSCQTHLLPVLSVKCSCGQSEGAHDDRIPCATSADEKLELQIVENPSMVADPGVEKLGLEVVVNSLVVANPDVASCGFVTGSFLLADCLVHWAPKEFRCWLARACILSLHL